MNRVFLKLGPITIYWYALLIVLSICIGIYFSTKEAKKNGLGRDFLMDLIFYVIPIGILGARLYYVIFNFSVFKDNLLDIFKIWEGGLAIYGAVISGIIFVVYFCKKNNKNILLTIDTIIPYLILGQAIGSGGLFGHGFNHTPIYFPEMQTDFIFAVFASNFGFAGVIGLLLLIVYFDISIVKLGSKSYNNNDKLLTGGIISVLLFQQIHNISMTIGLLPIMGITLPFISYGGSSLLSYMILIGMLFNISNENLRFKN